MLTGEKVAGEILHQLARNVFNYFFFNRDKHNNRSQHARQLPGI